MIIKSKDVLVGMIQSCLPTVDQITLEKSPDVTSGPGIKLMLESGSINPLSGTLSSAIVGWRIFYCPASTENELEMYKAFNTLIESVFDKAVWMSEGNIPFKISEAGVIRTDEDIYLKLIMSTTVNKNTMNYDPMKDVSVSIGG
tara:strand:+ start:1201 stop:1632 length:432 start_codon:yes stop_codon:yes gene_type:complete